MWNSKHVQSLQNSGDDEGRNESQNKKHNDCTTDLSPGGDRSRTVSHSWVTPEHESANYHSERAGIAMYRNGTNGIVNLELALDPVVEIVSDPNSYNANQERL
jgi:hypothetical protein